MVYACNQQGVDALNAMARAITQAAETIYSSSNQLRSTASGSKGDLGPHAESVEEICEEIINIIRSAQEPVGDISQTLTEVSKAYEEIIGNDRIKGSLGN